MVVVIVCDSSGKCRHETIDAILVTLINIRTRMRRSMRMRMRARTV